MICQRPDLYRHRAVLALLSLIGGSGSEVRLDGGIPAAIALDETGLLVVAGDHQRPLDPSALLPAALSRGADLLAVYVDPYRSGHPFLLDVVLAQAGPGMLLTECRLWVGPGGAKLLVPPTGHARCVAISPRGLRLMWRAPFAGEVPRLTGIARGQALLQRRIYGDTPFAAPLDDSHGG